MEDFLSYCVLYMIPCVFPRNILHYIKRCLQCQWIFWYFSQFICDFISFYSS